ncbi:MAG: right-handed parallel beta-helix repeat-containing protein [Actinomycetota bacterium]
MPARRCLLFALTALAMLAPALPAGAHAERESFFPKGEGEVPKYRTSGPRLLVCKPGESLRLIRQLPPPFRSRNLALYRECRRSGYGHIQEAVDHVEKRGSRIMILPGVYREEPSAVNVRGPCRESPQGTVLSYEDQFACPHEQNLITILGDSPTDEDRQCDLPVCDLQIEGTGDDPLDVIVDNNFNKLNGIRADRADGIYFRNFTVQRAEFNSLYILETDGFVIDRMLARWNDEYGFLTFATDHGLYKNCEAYGNGDSGIYPGSAADHHGAEVSIEITRCSSHHNLIGYSATAGNSTWVHHNWFFENAAGMTSDSFASGHPGMPQDSSRFQDNWIYSNNNNYYDYWRDGTCDKPIRKRGYERGVVCPHFQVPVGTGIVIGGGNANIVSGNWLYDNWRWGTFLVGVPAYLRGDMEPTHQFDTSHNNRFIVNRMGWSPKGKVLPNGTDFWWDEQGEGNCWLGNLAARGRSITSDPIILPVCESTPPPGLPVHPKQLLVAPCAAADPSRPDEAYGCDWFTSPPPPD